MHRIVFFPNLLFVALFLVTGGCDLLEESEHCKNETIDSKIWTPEKYPANAAILGIVDFEFELGSYSGANRGFQLSKVCPFGPIALKVVLKEKSIQQPIRPLYYSAMIVEDGSKKGYANMIKKEFKLYRVSPYELRGEGIAELGGLLEQEGRDFYVVCSAIFDKSVFDDELSYEKVAKDIVASVEYTVDYVLW